MLQIPLAGQLDSALLTTSRAAAVDVAALPLPYRGVFGAPRPPELAALALPPAPMPSRVGSRPLKSWRYVGVFGEGFTACVAAVRVGPARQWFWALWDRESGRLYERTTRGRRGGVSLAAGRAVVDAGDVRLELALEEDAGIETVCAAGAAYAWTRKQGGIRARGMLAIGAGPPRPVEARAVVDDTAAYYPRLTRWRWCAGVGVTVDGSELAWNLVDGVNDPPLHSERTVWVDGVAAEAGPSPIPDDLTSAGGLRFTAGPGRERDENVWLVRTRYRQPFGTFEGEIAGRRLAAGSGTGVMESMDAWW